MLWIMLYTAAGLVMIHGLIHLMGFVAYWPLGALAELPYKTTLLSNRWDLGAMGMRYFSLLWLAVAAGLLASVIGLTLRQAWWLPLMGIAVVLSLVVCILDWRNAWRGAVIDVVILVPLLLVWGLRVQPQPFAPYPQTTRALTAVPLPTDLPAPVARYFETIMGDEVPLVESAVFSGRGRLRFAGITFPARMRFTHDAGQGYRHYIEATLFGQPLMKANERYLDGQARMETPAGVVENEPKVDMAANLALWGESILLPSIYLTDPRVRWEAIDKLSARLIVPFANGEDTFTVVFDPETGLIKSMETLRYRDATDMEKTAWLLEPLSWEAFHGVLIPSRSAITWLDEGTPWLVIDIEDVALNVPVNETIRAEGP